MDSEFLKERAAHCRFLAGNSDPFIKRRLLDLAAKYEADFPKQPSQISINLTAQVVPASDTSQSITQVFNAGPKHPW
jgi:hypothetical protein